MYVLKLFSFTQVPHPIYVGVYFCKAPTLLLLRVFVQLSTSCVNCNSQGQHSKHGNMTSNHGNISTENNTGMVTFA